MLFNTDIAQQVHDGFEGQLIDATLKRTVVTGYDPVTDEETTETTEHDCEGFVETYSERMYSEGIVQQNDRKILILANSLDVTPTGGDEDTQPDTIEIEGNNFTVVPPVNRDPAGATWTIQGRL